MSYILGIVYPTELDVIQIPCKNYPSVSNFYNASI